MEKGNDSELTRYEKVKGFPIKNPGDTHSLLQLKYKND